MPISLKELRAATKTVEVKVLGETIHVKYRLYAITPAMMEKNKQTEDEVAFLTEYLPEVISEWDLLGEDGKPLPPNTKNLKNVPTRFLAETFTTIMEDQSPPKSGATGSLG